MFKSKGAASSETPKKTKSADQGSLMMALLPSVILYVGAVVLIVLTRQDVAGTIPYWEGFVPVVAFISLLSGFGQAYVRDQSYLFYVLKQIVHWGVLIGLLWLLHTQGVRAALDDQKYLLLLLYLLALGSLLAGLHLDWKFLFFGAFLAFATYLIAMPENTAILAPIGNAFGIADAPSKPQTMIIGTSVVAFLASTLLLIGMRGAALSKRISAAKA
ncbi:MAG: hypothetical protein LJE61_07625 [Thiocapsa sp.]|nr:hypothetical protein [Thiocapsa sp.]MCG6896114.1 hypothetical protein [Thiocapsa sp.]MCG6985048.1 hypothetical protein [Thiocapsa sp.]